MVIIRETVWRNNNWPGDDRTGQISINVIRLRKFYGWHVVWSIFVATTTWQTHLRHKNWHRHASTLRTHPSPSELEAWTKITSVSNEWLSRRPSIRVRILEICDRPSIASSSSGTGRSHCCVPLCNVPTRGGSRDPRRQCWLKSQLHSLKSGFGFKTVNAGDRGGMEAVNWFQFTCVPCWDWA